MTPSILAFFATHTDKLAIGDVLEIGSYNINGSIRSVIEDRSTSYLGVDIEEGTQVDMVIHDVDTHDFGRQFDTVVCCETLEHTLRPWLIIDAMHRLLKDGGLLLVSTPTFGFPLHRHPLDCYRFGEDTFRGLIFAGFDILALETVLDQVGDPIICCLGYSRKQSV